MSFDTKILTQKIEGLKEAYENGRFADVLVAAVNTGNGLMQQRIFTANIDTQGNGFGTYSKKDADVIVKNVKKKQSKITDFDLSYGLSPYEKKRRKHGRQILKKDLELFGGLRRAIETRVEGERAAVLQFNNVEAAKIARGQENQITNIRLGGKGTTRGNGIKIFRLNQVEKEEVISQASELIKEILRPKK